MALYRCGSSGGTIFPNVPISASSAAVMDATYNYAQSRAAAPKQKCFQLNNSITKIYAYVSGEATGVSVIALFLDKDGEGIACSASNWCQCRNGQWVEANIPSGYSVIVLYRYGGSNPMKIYFG